MPIHKKYFRYIAIIVMVFIVFWIKPVQAHPADMYFQAHTAHLTPDGIRLTWSLYLGPLLVPMVYTEIDRDGDQLVSDAEAQAWAAAIAPQFFASVEGTPLTWKIETVAWPESFKDFQVGNETILIEMQADWPVGLSNEHRLKLDNQYQHNISVNWFYLHGDEGVSFEKPVQDNGLLETTLFAQTGEALTYWDSGTPSLPALASRVILNTATGASTANSAEANRPIAVLTDLVSSPDLSLPFYGLALSIAVALGALHSLTPGHGKTVVAAYLVGSRGTMLHAVSLGTIVTLTHTGSVFALGLITLAASQYILPTSLFPILEIASGLLIVGLGASLLYQRWQVWQAASGEHYHDHDHHHDHDHDHRHGHHHHHHHVPTNADGMSWRSLVTLGVSGGLVPCPDAIAILLVAVAINRVVLGLSLIMAFSLGLAVVLIFIGIVMVRSRRLFDKMDAFNRWAPMLPVVSAIIVLALGLVLTVSAIRNLEPLTASPMLPQIAGLSDGQVEIEPTPAKNFELEQAGILFMDGDDQGQSQVFRTDLNGGQPVVLTENPFGVQDYALSPNGKTVVYTAMRDDGGSDLWTINADGSNPRELLACPNELCSGSVWSPDGQRLVYERTNPSGTGASAGLPSLWWYDIGANETGPVFQDSTWPGFNPRWSPDGQWLSYVYPGSGKMELYRLTDGRRISVDTQTGAPVEWSPRGDILLVTNVWDTGERSLIHLFCYDVATESLIDLSEISKSDDRPVMDSAGVWSPEGEWLVVVRRGLTEAGTTTGSRLWLVRPDGSEKRPLTEESDVIYGNPVWSPDGRYLLFHNYALAESLKAKIFWLDVKTGEMKQVAGSGSRPVWVW
jgi:ABC-type nickel/cobalt efflux system permease component RcnA/Tol biopolymer transport system component